MADETTVGELMDMVGDAGKLMMEAGGGAELVFEADAETGDPTRVALTLDGEVVVEGADLEDVAETVGRLRAMAGDVGQQRVRYVLGFAFSLDRSEVALIRKDHPEWQAGKLNGVGGKVEAGERPLDAMRREMWEEAGLWIATRTQGWHQIGALRGTDAEGWSWDVAVFECRTAYLHMARSRTDEEVEVVPTEAVPELEVVHNLRWLVPFAADDERPYVVADYSGVPNAEKAASQGRRHHEEGP